MKRMFPRWCTAPRASVPIVQQAGHGIWDPSAGRRDVTHPGYSVSTTSAADRSVSLVTSLGEHPPYLYMISAPSPLRPAIKATPA